MLESVDCFNLRCGNLGAVTEVGQGLFPARKEGL